MFLAIFIGLCILAIDAGIAYWLVNQFIKIPDATPKKKLIKTSVFILVTLLLAYLTFYLIVSNFLFIR